ncbi:hypothetical protein HDV00_008613 [Rhizophlyctis rosea]|nr:hypothetical protein HDV00_008613 [Rhizophlyctis rosea]
MAGGSPIKQPNDGFAAPAKPTVSKVMASVGLQNTQKFFKSPALAATSSNPQNAGNGKPHHATGPHAVQPRTPAPAAGSYQNAPISNLGKRNPDHHQDGSQGQGRRKMTIMSATAPPRYRSQSPLGRGREHDDDQEDEVNATPPNLQGFQARMMQNQNDSPDMDSEFDYPMTVDEMSMHTEDDYIEDPNNPMYVSPEGQWDRRVGDPPTPHPMGNARQGRRYERPAHPGENHTDAEDFEPQTQMVVHQKQRPHQGQQIAESPGDAPPETPALPYGHDMTDEQILAEIESLKQAIPQKMAELTDLLTTYTSQHATTMTGLNNYRKHLDARARAIDAKNEQVRRHFMGFEMFKGSGSGGGV